MVYRIEFNGRTVSVSVDRANLVGLPKYTQKRLQRYQDQAVEYLLNNGRVPTSERVKVVATEFKKMDQQEERLAARERRQVRKLQDQINALKSRLFWQKVQIEQQRR